MDKSMDDSAPDGTAHVARQDSPTKPTHKEYLAAYTAAGGKIPNCVNMGCDRPVAVRHWSNTGLPSLKTECTRCANARKNGKTPTGVEIVKKHFCENKTGCLGFVCPIDPSRYAKFPSDCYHMDHINGDHRDNRPENIMTLCTLCHTRKGAESGDFNGSKSSSLRFGK